MKGTMKQRLIAGIAAVLAAAHNKIALGHTEKCNEHFSVCSLVSYLRNEESKYIGTALKSIEFFSASLVYAFIVKPPENYQHQ